jgi:mono/diheme cytochrome c family protein
MLRCWIALFAFVPALLAADAPTATDSAPSPERGKHALLTKSYDPPTFTFANYDNAWKHWNLDKKPDKADYAKLFRQRYGLHPAPYPNSFPVAKGESIELPMGLKPADSLLGLGRKGMAQDCLVCHGGSIFGKSYVGLGNTSLDYHAFHEELGSIGTRKVKPPFTFTQVRGTVEAGAMAVFLIGYREPDLSIKLTRTDYDLQDDLCEDVPAWWLLKKKKTMYFTGGSDTRSVRSIMQFMMSPLNFPAAFHKAESDFVDILAYIKSIEAPKYPLEVDGKLAAQGAVLFKDNCARCHGTYGEKPTYPNKIIPLKEIGTDPRRFEGITKKFGEYYNKTWFAKDYKALESDGYQAPPLDGIWATAPYLHNGSVPTLYGVLNSKARPNLYTRSFGTDKADYDPKHVGWKVQLIEAAKDEKLPPIEQRKIYDTRKSGRSNAGHTYGDKLTEEERMALIEYLKTL